MGYFANPANLRIAAISSAISSAPMIFLLKLLMQNFLMLLIQLEKWLIQTKTPHCHIFHL